MRERERERKGEREKGRERGRKIDWVLGRESRKLFTVGQGKPRYRENQWLNLV